MVAAAATSGPSPRIIHRTPRAPTRTPAAATPTSSALLPATKSAASTRPCARCGLDRWSTVRDGPEMMAVANPQRATPAKATTTEVVPRYTMAVRPLQPTPRATKPNEATRSPSRAAPRHPPRGRPRTQPAGRRTSLGPQQHVTDLQRLGEERGRRRAGERRVCRRRRVAERRYARSASIPPGRAGMAPASRRRHRCRRQRPAGTGRGGGRRARWHRWRHRR